MNFRKTHTHTFPDEPFPRRHWWKFIPFTSLHYPSEVGPFSYFLSILSPQSLTCDSLNSMIAVERKTKELEE